MTTLQEAVKKFIEATKLDRIEFEDWPRDSQTAFESLRTALAQQGEPEVLAHDNCRAERICGIWCGNSACVSHTAAPAPQAQPMTNPCKTCSHFQEGKLPGVRIHDETCYECRSYWGNKWEAA